MINQVVLVGKVVKEIERYNKDGLMVGYLTIRTTNNNCHVKCTLYAELLTEMEKILKVGQYIGVKGHIEFINNKNEIVIDKITITA